LKTAPRTGRAERGTLEIVKAVDEGSLRRRFSARTFEMTEKKATLK